MDKLIKWMERAVIALQLLAIVRLVKELYDFITRNKEEENEDEPVS